MWMIANRLESFSPEIHIEGDDEPVLLSARLAYATNCVFVSKEKEGVICRHEDSWIRLNDMSLTQGFELVQNVFDYYEDWYDRIRELVEDRKYDEIINISWPILRNPVVLLNGNRQILGISRQYDPAEMDKEWRYLIRYGFSSAPSIHSWKQSSFSATRPGLSHFKATSEVDFNGATFGGIVTSR